MLIPRPGSLFDGGNLKTLSPRSRCRGDRRVGERARRPAFAEPSTWQAARRDYSKCLDSLGRGAAGFFAQVLDDEAQAAVQGELFEKFLPAPGIVDEGGGHEVGQHFHVAKL